MKSIKKDGLNVVPFIDIMLVLLAIVLSISTFIAQGKIQVDLPSANSATKEQKDEKKVVIVVDKDNKIFIDDIQTPEENLKEKLMPIEQTTLIELKSDKESKFNSFVKIIDILKEKGHENFAITTVSE
ncbi:TonB system transport protein ExbD [Campylobacter mucosalis]|uniref:Biopolymer transport protein ExbD n=1 Tax=Campylobacter mucosalis CCUG 21559 TaxID=1032067 RepID=A0A6G5QGG7_9BACT|nr:TonB system transport protein ExbD [Campylobacter mucosalis]KEA46113.1 biopolymer transporter ExbD [Campylobacter mucosalis]QCD44596.1 TonB system transport protein ExbD [Campylobacter mucosalis CCUG 21559]QKF62562.1 TonB system transport protein ExbD [Campylobacter mucosalis]